MTRLSLFLSSMLVVAGTGSLFAQGGNASDDRYLITEVEDGILKVDRQTGEVTLCRSRGGQWVCELVPDERAVGLSSPAEDDFDNADDLTKEDIDNAVDTFEYMVDRFLGAAERLRENPNYQPQPQSLPAPSR